MQQRLSQELHIAALQKATFILNALSADASDAVDRLRALLANRSAEPTVYRSMQRQRWMEERRHVALDQLSKTLCTELARLSSSTYTGQTLASESSNSNSKPNMNLIKFFELSRHQTLIRSRIRRRMPLLPKLRDEQPNNSRLEIPRRHNENYLIPLILKPTQHRHFFPPFTPQPSQALSGPSSPVDNVTSTPSIASDSSNLETIAEENETTPHIPLPINYNQDETDGTALIWRDAPRSKEEILGDLHVTMPDYVMDLLADFETNSRPSPITPSPPTTPRKPIHKSSSRQMLSTLFFGIPETFTSRLTNTSGSDSPKASRVRLGMPPVINAITEEPLRTYPMAFSEFNPGNSDSQAPDTEQEKMIVRIKRRISTLRRIS